MSHINPPTRPGAPSITPATLPSPSLRKTAIFSFLPALPLCITHGALSKDIVPALGLIPLFFSAAVSLFLVLQARMGSQGKGKGRQTGERGDLEGWIGGPDEGENDEEGEGEGVGVGGSGIGPGEDENENEDEDGDRDVEGWGATSVLTHRITVFVVDVALATGVMVVLVFTWIGTGRARRPELAMLAAYSTMPLLVNFLIHLCLAAREFSAGLALPGLVEYTAWRAVPADCPHCGSQLRPDSLPPIPWYETVSRPNVSLSQVKAPSVPRLSLPRFSALKGPREWTVPRWMRRRDQDASLFVDDEQIERDRYRDDPEAQLGEQSGPTTVVATGSTVPAPVEEVVVGKKKGKSGTSAALFGEEDASWS